MMQRNLSDEEGGREEKIQMQSVAAAAAAVDVKKVQVSRSWTLEIAPPQIIAVDRSPRAAKLQLDTIREEEYYMTTVEYLVSEASDMFLKPLVMMGLNSCGEVAPPPFISVKKSKLKQLLRSKKLLGTSLDTILEESIHYAEHLVSEAADTVFRPLSNVNSYFQGNNLFSSKTYSWINNNNNSDSEVAHKVESSLQAPSSLLESSNLNLVQQAAAGSNLGSNLV